MRLRRTRKRYTPAAIMARSKLFQDYQRAFLAASGLPLTIVEPDSSAPIEWPAKTANPFCARLAGTVNACASCREFQTRLATTTAAPTGHPNVSVSFNAWLYRNGSRNLDRFLARHGVTAPARVFDAGVGTGLLGGLLSSPRRRGSRWM